jgi:hypothetical protein
MLITEPGWRNRYSDWVQSWRRTCRSSTPRYHDRVLVSLPYNGHRRFFPGFGYFQPPPPPNSVHRFFSGLGYLQLPLQYTENILSVFWVRAASHTMGTWGFFGFWVLAASHAMGTWGFFGFGVIVASPTMGTGAYFFGFLYFQPPYNGYRSFFPREPSGWWHEANCSPPIGAQARKPRYIHPHPQTPPWQSD